MSLLLQSQWCFIANHVTHVTKAKVYWNILVKKLNEGIFTHYLKGILEWSWWLCKSFSVDSMSQKTERSGRGAYFIILFGVGAWLFWESFREMVGGVWIGSYPRKRKLMDVLPGTSTGCSWSQFWSLKNMTANYVPDIVMISEHKAGVASIFTGLLI